MKNITQSLLLILLLVQCDTKNTSIPIIDVATLRVETENEAPIISKTTYISANISIESQGKISTEKIRIRGRGNTTWTYPKKPYKLEFDKKNNFLGLPAEKEWVLLANYLDGSLMLNSMAMKVGELLKMPYTNHVIPVDLWINEQYQGSYILTEQIEVNENRIAIGENGILLSLDQVIEPTDQSFISPIYKLPVIIKNPKKLSPTQLSGIKTEFNALETAISDINFPNNNYEQIFDIDALSNYLLVYMLTCNEEINHPKSTYIYKAPNGKYTMGPIWDFDWAFSYEERQKYYTNPERALFWDRKSSGEVFFKRIYSDPKIKKLLSQKWQQFKINSYPILMKFLEDYATEIERSRNEDHKKWKRGNSNFDLEKESLRNWFIKRGQYLDLILHQ